MNLLETWRYRELLYFLVWRDVIIRYKQAVLGVAWAVLQPVATIVVFSFVFGYLLGVNSGPVPYPVFALCGLLPWQLFSGALTRAGASVVGNSNLITKVYFPRLIIPLSAVLGGLVDFAISAAVLATVLVIYDIPPSARMLWLPVFVLLALATAAGVALWLSALNVLYRDVQYVVPLMIQLWMFLSPVAYSATAVPQGIWRFIYGLNPMAGVIVGFRWAILGGTAPDLLALVATAMVMVVLVSGLYYFRRAERTFADVI